ncbi:hypothetical protein K438DRAFT_1881365 [Mycena galopus ATCC 62051]|nr:hypothetical protein K438DRAFT_1881365 [Mycena galopus ATCC 62051]
MAQSSYSSTDSNSIRASVYDVFLELGALDTNSRVREWIFTDPSCVLSDPDEVAWRSPRETVKFVDGSEHGHGFHRGRVEVDSEAEAKSATTRPPSFAKSLGLTFSPTRIGSRSSFSPTISTTSSPTSSPSSGNGYETDEGYQSATNTPKKSRVRAVFSLSPTKSAPVLADASTKPLPTLPPIRERLTLTRTVSSVFRKRSKSPTAEKEDDLEQWHEISALTPRIYNPSADNGVALAPPPRTSFRHVPPGPSSFRQILSAPAEDNSENPTFALPRTLFRSVSLTKRRLTSRAKPPQPLDLAYGDEPPSPRLATSLPSTPFVLLTEGEANPTPGPQTPFVFVAGIDNPTPLNSARRFSDVTSMTAPIYPVSIRTPRRSLVLEKFEPSFPLRHSSSGSSLQAALIASAASPYDIYNQPIPTIQRGKEAPFPSRPVLPQPLSATAGGESRMATIQRYREFSEQLVELTPHKRFTEM